MDEYDVVAVPSFLFFKASGHLLSVKRMLNVNFSFIVGNIH